MSRCAEGPGREILKNLVSFHTVTRKRIDVFSRNFAGTCTMSWGCAYGFFFIDGMWYEFFCEQNKK